VTDPAPLYVVVMAFAANHLPRLTRGRAGFTLMELTLGMLVTGLVMIAVSALLSAVARGWEQSGATQVTSLYRVQTHARIEKYLRGAKQIGAVRSGSVDGTQAAAGVMLWAGDANLDNKVQFSELGLLAHEGGVGTSSGYLAYYDVSYPASWTASQKSAADTPALADDEIYNNSNIDTFRTLANVRKTVVATNVVGARFTKTDGVDVTRPTLEYALKFQKDGGTDYEYGSVSTRTPTTLPASQR
jgi:hypothetical protein